MIPKPAPVAHAEVEPRMLEIGFDPGSNRPKSSKQV